MPGANTRGQALAAVTPNKKSKKNGEDSPKSSQRASATKKSRKKKNGQDDDDDDRTKTSGEGPMDLSDDETIQGGSAGRKPRLYRTRCTLKLKVTGGKNAFGRAVGSMKELFTQLKIFDEYTFIAPWYDNAHEGIKEIEDPKDLSADPTTLISYFPRFMNRKIKETSSYFEYVNIQIGHSIDITELSKDLGTWLQKGEHALYIDMLQCERKREAGFFTNSFFTMDLEVLRELLESYIGCCVGLRWKPIAGTYSKDGEPVRAIHVEVDSKFYHQGLKKLSEIFGKGVSGFVDGRKMRFFASLLNVKSKETRGAIRKAIERQKFFVSMVKKDYFSDILHLDVVPKNSKLATMREMITQIKSLQFPHLQMIHSVDETWSKILYKGDFTYLVMPHIEEEADLMMSNLLPYLRHIYGDDILPYFTAEAKEVSMEDKWDPVNKRVICMVDTNAEIEDDEDVLGFDEARKFLSKKKDGTVNTNSPSDPVRPTTEDTPQANLELQQAAAEKINAMTNVAEAAYYKEDDSITTMGSLVGTNITESIRTQSANENQSGAINQSRAQDTDNLSIASSITMESFTNLQTRVMNQDKKLNHINLLLGRMAEVVLKEDKMGQSKSTKEDADAGGDESPSGEGQ